jgi:hypothetical protein
MAIIGIEQPVKKLEAEASNKDTRFVVGIDERAFGTLLDRLPALLGTPGAAR